MVLTFDVSDCGLTEDFIHLLHEFSTTLNSTSNLQEALEQFLELTLYINEIDCCWAYFVDELTGGIKLVGHKGLSQRFVENVSYFSTNSIQAHLAMTRQPIYKHYSELIYTSKDRICRCEGLRATAIIPVWYKNQLVAVFYFSSHTADDIPSVVRTMIETFSAQMGGVIVRLKSEEMLLKIENKFHMIIGNNPLKFIQLLIGHDQIIEPASQGIADLEHKKGRQSPSKQDDCLVFMKEKFSNNEFPFKETSKSHEHVDWL